MRVGRIAAAGEVSNGKLLLDLPGKLRLDYINPNNILITCKGFWIVVQVDVLWIYLFLFFYFIR